MYKEKGKGYEVTIQESSLKKYKKMK